VAAVLFDLDGVLTPTAEVHRRAWGQLFTELFEARGVVPGYQESDYFDHLDGMPRYDGVREELAAHGVMLPEGTADDPPALDTVCGLGNRKNQLFRDIVAADGVAPYPGTVAVLDRLGEEGVQVAVVSSSRNAKAVLTASGLARYFRVVVDGQVAAVAHLAGKPAPDTFLHAAGLLGVPASGCAVVEDAAAGVAAGRAGRFGLVVGVDRGAGAEALRAAGADRVVTHLGALFGWPAPNG
jgi:beta-phosphoglucomutase family hydrolase